MKNGVVYRNKNVYIQQHVTYPPELKVTTTTLYFFLTFLIQIIFLFGFQYQLTLKVFINLKFLVITPRIDFGQL